MIPCRILLLFYILSSLCHSNGYSQDLLSYENSLKFATYLFETKQYQESAIEFERVIFIAPNDTAAKLQLIKSYRYAGNYTKAKSRLENIFPENVHSLQKDFAKEYIKVLLHEYQYQELASFLNENQNLPLDDTKGYQYGALIMQNKWHEAKAFRENNTNPLSQFSPFNPLRTIEEKGLEEKYKNAFLASGMSALVPGSGKIYTNQWKDAIFTFLFVSAASYITYRSYTNNGFNGSTIFLGSIAAGFYLSNIYGSYKSAKRYNQRINHVYTHDAEDILLRD